MQAAKRTCLTCSAAPTETTVMWFRSVLRVSDSYPAGPLRLCFVVGHGNVDGGSSERAANSESAPYGSC